MASRATSPTCRADRPPTGRTRRPCACTPSCAATARSAGSSRGRSSVAGFTYVVISQQRAEVEALRARGVAALLGEASNIELLERAHVEHARVVIVASSDPHLNHLIVERAKALNPSVDFVVRTRSDEETAQLRAISPKVQTVLGQRELAVQMARYSLRRFGVNAAEAEAIAQGLRGRPIAPVATPRPSPPGLASAGDFAVSCRAPDHPSDGPDRRSRDGAPARRRLASAGRLLRSRAPRPRSRDAPRRGTSRGARR